jgi:hypothetical protein
MAGQISLETAADVWRKQCGVLYTTNLILEARVGELEAELKQLRGDAPDPHPSAGGSTPEQG